MTMSRLFQEFGGDAADQGGSIGPTEEGIEDQKLQSFEDGYRAGWDDSMRAQSQTAKHIAADFGRNLQEASFSYHEARSAMTKAVEELFEPILDALLPAVARTSIGGHIVEHVKSMTRAKADRRIEVTVSPNNEATVASLLKEKLPEPFDLVTDPDLGDGQVYLRLGPEESEIDLDRVIGEIRDSVQAFFHQSHKEPDDV